MLTLVFYKQVDLDMGNVSLENGVDTCHIARVEGSHAAH